MHGDHGGDHQHVDHAGHLQQGKLRKVGENGSSSVQRTNIIDTIGFCDSVFTPKQVLDVIKSSVKVNVCHIDKVKKRKRKSKRGKIEEEEI